MKLYLYPYYIPNQNSLSMNELNWARVVSQAQVCQYSNSARLDCAPNLEHQPINQDLTQLLYYQKSQLWSIKTDNGFLRYDESNQGPNNQLSINCQYFSHKVNVGY